jgi:transposase
MAGISIREAAQLQGVSQDTIRRRIRRGELNAYKEPTPQGFRWVVELEEATAQVEPPQVQGQGIGDAQAGEGEVLRELVATLRSQVQDQGVELESRRREVSELHILLQQKALPAPEGRPWWRRLWQVSPRDTSVG